MPEQIIHNQCLSCRECEGARSVNKVKIPVLSATGVRAHYVWKLPLDVSCCPRLCALWPSFERRTWPSGWGLKTTALSHTFVLVKTVNNHKTYSINKWNIDFVFVLQWCVCVYTCINHVHTVTFWPLTSARKKNHYISGLQLGFWLKKGLGMLW